MVLRFETFDSVVGADITTANTILDFASGLKTQPELNPPVGGTQVGIKACRTNSNSSGFGGFNLGDRPRGTVSAKMLVNRNNPAFTATASPPWPIPLLTLTSGSVEIGSFEYGRVGDDIVINFVHPDPADINSTLTEVVHVVPVSAPPDWDGLLWREYRIEFITTTQVIATVFEYPASGDPALIYGLAFPFPTAQFAAAEAVSAAGQARFNVFLDITGHTGEDADCAHFWWSSVDVRAPMVNRVLPRSDGEGGSTTPRVFPPGRERNPRRPTGYL